MAGAAETIPALVVGQQQEQVGPIGGKVGRGDSNDGKKENEAHVARLDWRRAAVREQIALAEYSFPRLDRPAHEHTARFEGIGFQQFFGLFRRVRFIDDQRPAVVRERTGGGELALLQQIGQVLSMRRTDLFDFGLVRRVLNGGGELHIDLTPASAVTLVRAPSVACARECAPNNTAANPRSPASVKLMNGKPAT